MPVFAAKIVGRVHAQQVGNVRIEAVVSVQPPAVDVLFGHVREVVAHLGQAVGNMFFCGILVRLEDQPHLRAFQNRCIELPAGRGNCDKKALVVGQNAVANIQPQGVRLARLHRKSEV